ncbi:tail fiber protein [Bartonella gliris]|uniref:tail fiber protein n=1 Tax=Bartonella gliris TaxID=3004109 RepID=UPI00295EB457|nr:tail fiber protein [Bartonella gliris]
MSSIYDWSLMASENAYADDMINWAEGQPPSSVNDSARAMMQRIKEYLLDNGGVTETQFTVREYDNTTSIRLTTKSLVTSYMNGIVVRFKAQGVNKGKTTVALNQLTALPVYKATADGIEPLRGGEVQSGGLYELVYSSDIAGKNLDGWFLTNPTIKFPESFPAGFIATFAMEKMPEGWLLCDGKAYSRKDYANLFAAIGETWGRGNFYSTFNVPDLRGMFLRGLDSGNKIDKGRVLGSRQEDSFKAHTHEGKTDSSGAHQHHMPGMQYDLARLYSGQAKVMFYNTSIESPTNFAGAHTHKLSLEKTGGGETRPVNVAVVYAIKT